MRRPALRLPYVDESPAVMPLGGARRRCPLAPRSFVESVACALTGFRYAFETQRNLRIQVAIGAPTIFLAFALRLPSYQVALLGALVAMVLFAELVNTALELLLDHVVGIEYDLSVKLIKDIAASAVLVVSLGAAAVGIAVFLPYVKPAAWPLMRTPALLAQILIGLLLLGALILVYRRAAHGAAPLHATTGALLAGGTLVWLVRALIR